MSDRLQEAITLIKSGKKQAGQQLLLKILTDEPDNEHAWLWLSAVVSADKRRYCIEKVLSINPNNQQAKRALVKLAQAEVGPSPPPSRSSQTSSPPAKPSSSRESVARPSIPKQKNLPRPVEPAASVPSAPDISQPDSGEPDGDRSMPEFWVNRERNLFYITALLENELVSATINPDTAKKVQAELLQGNFPLDMLTKKKVMPFNKITEVSQTMSSVRVFYTEAGSSKSTGLECKDDEMAEAIVNALQKRLGSRFTRTSNPMGRGKITAVSLISMTVLLGITTFCYFGAFEAASGSLTPAGSARTRGMVALLGLLGPNGVACLGGILFLLALVVIVYYLANPPLVTKLIPNRATPSQNRSH